MLKKFVEPLFETIDAEAEHTAIRDVLAAVEQSVNPEELLSKLRGGERVTDARLKTSIAGVPLENPLIVGPGWDKVGRSVHALTALGFAGVEVGSIMKSPQSGNPRPRHFWLAPGVAINRYGFNTPGMEVVAEHLSAYKDTAHVIGINIGKNKTTSDADAPAEFAAVATRFASRGNYFVINVSSPNTPGLRALQDKGPLLQIITSVKAALAAGNSKAPLFVKIAPDMTFEAIADVISVVHESGIAGIIAANTTVSADLKAKYGEQWRNEAGGLSGDVPGFRAHVTEIIRFIRKEAGKSVTIIGAGGVKDATTVLEKIHAGASAVELVASIDEYGPSIARDTLLDIKAFLESNNTTIEQIVAAA